MGEDFRAWNRMKAEKKASNREQSLGMLREAGVTVEEKNLGAHLIVTGHDGRKFDFWPGTGKWIERGSSTHHRGVRSLLAVCVKRGEA
jgi:hypothetical protein